MKLVTYEESTGEKSRLPPPPPLFVLESITYFLILTEYGLRFGLFGHGLVNIRCPLEGLQVEPIATLSAAQYLHPNEALKAQSRATDATPAPLATLNNAHLAEPGRMTMAASMSPCSTSPSSLHRAFYVEHSWGREYNASHNPDGEQEDAGCRPSFLNRSSSVLV